MALYYYRRTRLNLQPTYGERLAQFLKDIVAVYPGPLRDDNLQLMMLEFPTPEYVDIKKLVPAPSNTESEVEDVWLE